MDLSVNRDLITCHFDVSMLVVCCTLPCHDFNSDDDDSDSRKEGPETTPAVQSS